MLLGGAFGSFEVTAPAAAVGEGGAAAAGAEGAAAGGEEREPPKFYPQAHAYEYCKSEYYVQVGVSHGVVKSGGY